MVNLRLLLILTAIAMLMVAPSVASAGGGGGGGGGPCAAFASGSKLAMLDNCFNGMAHFTSAGETLTIRNDGLIPHSYTAVDGSFDTGLVEAGETAQVAVGEGGIVPVYCTLHGTENGHGMAGLLIVGDPSAQAISAVAPIITAAGAAGGEAHMKDEFPSQQQTLDQVRVKLDELQAAVERSQADDSRDLLMASAAGLLGVALGGIALVRTRH